MAVVIGSYVVLTHAGDCSDLLSWQDGQIGGTGTKARYTRIEPRVATSCEEQGRDRVAGGVVKGTLVPLPAPWLPDLLTLAGTSGQAE